MKKEYAVVGKGLPRVDGLEKVTGRAQFTIDVTRPGMLYGRLLRSPHPHARILHIDTSRAERVPGVRAVITGQDVRHIRYAFVDTPRYPADQHPLAVDRVRYIGDEVAAVAAESGEVAAEALSLIRVEYEELPAIFTPEEALAPDAPRLHEHDYEGRSVWEEWGVKRRGRPPVEGPPNLSGRTYIEYGNVERGLARAVHVREDRFELKATAHCALEPHVAVAEYDPVSGRLHLWLATMGIFYKRFILAKALGLPQSKVRVHQSYVGGAFGGKIDVFPYEFCAAFLAMRLGRPVKFELSREEVFTTTRQRHPAIITLRTGVDRHGTILAQDIKVIVDNGAYRGTGPVVIYLCHAFNLPIYRVPDYRYEGLSVYTNNPVRGPQRGHGAPQIRFAVDSQLDMIAADLGLDPVEVMLRNCREPGEVLPNGDRLDSCGLKECISGAAQAAGWAEKRRRSETGNARKRRGIGISACSMFSGAPYYPFASAAVVKLHDDGAVTLFTGASEMGQGAFTTLAQVAAEELGIGLEKVSVIGGDTELGAIDMGQFLSGGAYVTGNAVRRAARDALEQLYAAAAPLLEARLEDLDARDGYIFVRGVPDRRIPFSLAVQASILRNDGNPVIGRGSYKSVQETDHYPSLAKGTGRFTEAYGFSAHVAEVEVDTVTGEVELKKVTVFHDCGYPLNRDIVEGQIHGCVSMGQGQALGEEIVLDRGQVFNPSFLDYQLPLMPNTPEIQHRMVESIEPKGPFGAKEVGEGSVAGMLAAVANAVYDAVGVRVNSLPITAEKVYAGLEAKGRGEGKSR